MPMTNPQHDILNRHLPIARAISDALHMLPDATRTELLDTLSENEFISERVDIYLAEWEKSIRAGFDELGAKEIAWKECTAGIVETNE